MAESDSCYFFDPFMRPLVTVASQLCEWLSLRDCHLDFSLPLSQTNYGLKFHSTVKSLSLIDSQVSGLDKFFREVLKYRTLEQFILIYNKEADESDFVF